MKRKLNVAVQKDVGAPVSQTPDEATRRLENIRPREVSLVDQAANGRSFLVVKRRQQLQSKNASIFKEANQPTETTPASAATETPAVKEAPAQEPAAAAAPAVTETPAAAPAVETPVVVEKGEFQKIVEGVLGNISVAKSLAFAQKDMFAAMSEALLGMAISMDMIRADLNAFSDSDGKTGFAGIEVMKAALKTEFPEASEAELTEKAGRKMKKDRLMKLKQLHGDLDSLIKELDQDTEVSKGGTVKTQPAQAQQETNKAAGATQEAAAPAAAPAAAQAASEQPAAAPVAAAEQSIPLSQVEALVAKAVKPLQDEITALKAQPAAPASEPAQGSEDVVTNKGAGEKVSLFKGII